LNASNLSSGTIPDARFPATLPAASAANLTSIPSANLTGALPAIDGSNLTGIAADKIFEGNTEVETVDTGSDGHIKITTEGTEKIRIKTNGNIGLGIDNPLTTIHAYASTPTITLRDSSANATFVEGATASDVFVGSSSNHPLLVKTNNTERCRVNTDGHVVPGSDSTYDLGLTGTRWRNVYADTLYGDGSNLTNLPSSLAGASNEKLFVEAENQMDASFTTTANFNYVAASPMTIASSATLTVSASSTMTFV
jgi:hypothetical protein